MDDFSWILITIYICLYALVFFYVYCWIDCVSLSLLLEYFSYVFIANLLLISNLSKLLDVGNCGIIVGFIYACCL